jgi:hypothetical protein
VVGTTSPTPGCALFSLLPATRGSQYVRETARADSRRSGAGPAPRPQALPVPATALILYKCVSRRIKSHLREPTPQQVTMIVLLAFYLLAVDGRDLSLKLSKVSQATSPKAACIDGTAPAYYWREGAGTDATKAILFLEGGGWCYPSDINQTSGSNCAVRAKSALGSSKRYGPSIASTGYEGGSGYTSGDPTKTAFANFAVSYVKYCDGGSFTGKPPLSSLLSRLICLVDRHSGGPNARSQWHWPALLPRALQSDRTTGRYGRIQRPR